MEMYETILETLGNTPLVKLGGFIPGPPPWRARSSISIPAAA